MENYDKYIVAFSGGKDSTACFLHLLELGIPKDKIELWHHEIDGKDDPFMDWNITPDYCRAFAKAFNVPIYFSWKQGGFKREMMRKNQLTAPISFENEDLSISFVGGVSGNKNTRRKFPQISANLSVRWCSAYLKIDVCTAAIRNQDRFKGIKTLVISGERGEESTARSNYAIFEPDRADLRNGVKFQRHVDRWRPIRDWEEAKVWEIMERHSVRAHPAYFLGWGRVSCLFCIFGDKDQFCSAYCVSSNQGDEIIQLEKEFECTIKRDKSVPELIREGSPYHELNDAELLKIARGNEYTLDIIMDHWILPYGAFKRSNGPS